MRYYEDHTRKCRHEELLERGIVFTYEQIYDILELVRENKSPDWTYGDDECVLYEIFSREKHAV